MKKKNLFIISICTVLALSAIICVSIFSISATETISTQESTIETNDIDIMIAEYEQLEKEMDENDLLALTILRKYKKSELTELPDDRETNYQLMDIMCNMISNDEVTEDESTVFKNFLDRRYFVLLDTSVPEIEGQDELQLKIESILGFDHWER